MFIKRCRPFRNVWNEMQQFHDDLNRALNRAGSNRAEAAASGTFPPLNIWDEGEALQVEAELPGMELNDLEIYVTSGNQFTVKGERKAPQAESTKWHRRERGIGTFSRTIELPVAVDEEKVTATFAHGVLKVTLPKAAEVKPRRIQIKVD